MGKLLYEIKPWAFVLMGTMSFVNIPSRLARISALLLLTCSFLILHMRREYRRVRR